MVIGEVVEQFRGFLLDIRENRPGEAIRELDAYLAAVPDAPDKEKVLALRSQLRQKK